MSQVEDAGLDYIQPHRTQSLVLPRMDGLNEVLNIARTHWSQAAKHKESLDEVVMWHAKAQKLEPIPGAFRVEFVYSERDHRRDPDNIVSAKKFIFDGLQKQGIIKKDSQKYVLGWTERWQVADAKFPEGIHIKLIEE